MTNLRMTLNGFKPRNTLLLVFSPNDHHHAYRIQKELVIGCEAVLQGHGMILAEIFEQGNSHIGSMELDAESCDYLRKLFNITVGQFKIILLNKQQHIKMMTDTFVSDRELLMRMENFSESLESVS